MHAILDTLKKLPLKKKTAVLKNAAKRKLQKKKNTIVMENAVILDAILRHSPVLF